MTHYPNIHTRAENLVRESRGRLTLREAYSELSRRAQVAKAARKVESLPKPSMHAWQMRADMT